MVSNQIPLLVICGPTASGKTGWALDLARHYPLEIISADSRQVYRQMNIGTAKATAEEQAAVPHHMLDLINPDVDFSVADYVTQARPLLQKISHRGNLPCLVGGTGLYIRALLGGLAPLPAADSAMRTHLRQQEEKLGKGGLHKELAALDPVAAECIHPNNLVKVIRALEVYYLSGRKISEFQAEHKFSDQPYRSLRLAPALERDALFKKIDKRAEQMLADGLIGEVRDLLKSYPADLPAFQTLGYREVLRYLDEPSGEQQMLAEISLYTRRYAKRQLTWFRKDPEIIWVDSSTESGRVLRSIDEFLNR